MMKMPLGAENIRSKVIMYKLTNKDKAMLCWLQTPKGEKAATDTLSKVSYIVSHLSLVRKKGVEPLRLATIGFEPTVSAVPPQSHIQHG